MPVNCLMPVKFQGTGDTKGEKGEKIRERKKGKEANVGLCKENWGQF